MKTWTVIETCAGLFFIRAHESEIKPKVGEKIGGIDHEYKVVAVLDRDDEMARILDGFELLDDAMCDRDEGSPLFISIIDDIVNEIFRQLKKQT